MALGLEDLKPYASFLVGEERSKERNRHDPMGAHVHLV